jgi:hypothetical protein
MQILYILVAVIFLFPGLSLSEIMPLDSERVTLTVAGEYRYGPNVSEQEACRVAVQRAKEDALRRVFGEIVSADEQFSCREKSGSTENRQCAYDKSTWSMIDGEIGNAVQKKYFIFDEQGAKRCWVELSVEVLRPTKKPSFELDLKVNLGSYQYKSGDNLIVDVTPYKPLYLAIFSWTPNSSDPGIVSKIFPNSLDQNSLITARRKIPQKGLNGINYEFKLINDEPKKDFIDEYLIFVITKKNLKWMDEYPYDDFRLRLREIPGDEKRTIKRAYRIFK